MAVVETFPEKELVLPRYKAKTWERLGLAALLASAALLFLWGLDRNGWANPYYSAAAQAGAQDWKAFFFAATDAGNMVSIDKLPLSVWVTSLSVRAFGLSSWSILAPQAIMGVATTMLIYKIIRRSHGPAPALFGGLIYATTPVIVLMSRFNNPEPLMGLLTVGAAYFVVRALDDFRWKWYLLAGAALGLGFMTKQMQALLIIPALVVAVVVIGAGPLWSRIRRLLGALVMLVVSGGWWMAIVDLTPADQRPYVGGSLTNSAVELTLDYNGLARFIRLTPIGATTSATASDSRTPDIAPYDGGLSRMFNGNFAPEAGWLLFPALAVLVVLVALPYMVSKGRAVRGLAIMSSVWFLTVFLVLSFMGTMIHSYYTFSLGAPVALLVPVGLVVLWRHRESPAIRLSGALIVASSAYMAVRVMQYSDDWPSALEPMVIAFGATAALGWVFARNLVQARIVMCLLVASMVAGPLMSDIFTISSTQAGTNPVSGPLSNNPAAISRHLEDIRKGHPLWAQQIAYGTPAPPQLTNMLSETKETWAAATYTAQNAALYQLSSNRPVMAIGGWLGKDPAPDLRRFKELVADGRIRYFIPQRALLDRGTVGPNSIEITEWVQATYPAQTVEGVEFFDLRTPRGRIQ